MSSLFSLSIEAISLTTAELVPMPNTWVINSIVALRTDKIPSPDGPRKRANNFVLINPNIIVINWVDPKIEVDISNSFAGLVNFKTRL